MSSTFMANEDQPTQWGIKGEKMMKPKSKGAGIMVSDFIDEHNGFLALTAEVAKASNPDAQMYSHHEKHKCISARQRINITG